MFFIYLFEKRERERERGDKMEAKINLLLLILYINISVVKNLLFELYNVNNFFRILSANFNSILFLNNIFFSLLSVYFYDRRDMIE